MERKLHVIMKSPVDVTMELSSPELVKLLKRAGLKCTEDIWYLARSFGMISNFFGFGFSFPIRCSKPVLPFVHRVGMIRR